MKVNAELYYRPGDAANFIERARLSCDPPEYNTLARRLDVDPETLRKLRRGQTRMTYAMQVTLEALADSG